MSQSVGGGRESRLNQSSTKTGVTESSSVTVKTLPNSSYGRRGGSREQSKAGFTERSSSRAEKVQTPTILVKGSKASNSGVSGPLKEKQSSSSNSNQTHSVQTQNTKYKGESNHTDKRISKPGEEKPKTSVIEVRTQGNPRDARRTPKTGGRPRINSNGTSSYASTGNSRATRVFTASEKHRNNLSNHINRPQDATEIYRRSIPDVTLCKLLENVAYVDSREANQNIKKLEQYLSDSSNARSIQKAGQNLWDALITIQSMYKSSGSNTLQHSLIVCLAKVGKHASENVSYNNGYHSRFIDWLLKAYDNSVDDDKISLMSVLHELLEYEIAGNSVNQLDQSLMSQLHSLLDNAETGKVLVAVLENVLCFAKHAPNVFSSVFPDVVDILIGWYLELGQSDDTISQITKALISLHEYWTVNIHWCKLLTGQFLEDAEAYCTDYSALSMNDPKFETCVDKLILLLKVFKTIVEASGEYFSPEKSTILEKGHIRQCLEKILKCYGTLVEKGTHIELGIVVDECIYILAPCGEDLADVQILSNYLVTKIKHLPELTFTAQVSCLNAVSKLFRECDVSKLSTVTDALHTTELTNLKLSTVPCVQKSMLALFHSLFSVKDMKVIQSTYKIIKSSFDLCLRTLSGDVELLWNESRADIAKSKERAADLTVFHLTCLSQVATDSNNIILMYALEPSIFSILLQDILQEYGKFIKCYPTLLLCIIKLLHLHSSSNKNFIAKSNLCTTEPKPKKLSKITMTISSGDNFSLLLKSYEDILSLCKGNARAVVLVTKWMYEILEQIVSVKSSLLSHHLLINTFKQFLLLDSSDYVESVLLYISKCLVILLPFRCLTDSVETIVIDFTLHQLSCELESVQQAYMNVLTQLPVSQLTKLRSNSSSNKYGQIHTARRDIMNGRFGSLTQESFKSLARILFIKNEKGDDLDIDTLQAFLLTTEKPSSSIDRVFHHVGLLEFWCLWQAADFCVAHRLRTPIGKPIDTFMAIESAIKQIAADRRSEVTPKCGVNAHKVWRLLQFLENLEKTLYNAYEGTAGHITTHNKLVKSFFRTNKGTCIEWLTRIRLHILCIASIFNHPATVIRHGYELITDMVKNHSTQTPEFELVLVYLTESWCKLNCFEAIQGLYDWCKNTCSKKLPWIKATIPKAMHKYETAIVELKATLKNLTSPQTHVSAGENIQLQTRPPQPTSAVTKLCAQQITNCYTSLQTWPETAEWLKEFDELKSQNALLADVDPVHDSDKILLKESAGLTVELMSWSKEQHVVDIWTRSLGTGTTKLINPVDHTELGNIIKLESCYDWPVSVNPNTLLTLQSLSINNSVFNLSQLQDHTSELAWMLQSHQLVEKSSVSEDEKLQSLLSCCQQARKSSNLRLADSLMSRLQSYSSESISDTLKLKISREVAKQMFAKDSQEAALLKMVEIASHTTADQDVMEAELIARSTLTTVKWLQSDSKQLSHLTDETALELLPGLADLKSSCGNMVTDSSTVPFAEQFLGSLLRLSTLQCPSLAKSWYNFANWAYKWGRKCLDNADNVLTDDELEKIDLLLPKRITKQERADILSVMSMVQGHFSPAEEDLADDAPDYGDDDIIEIRRRLISSCPSLSAETLDGLVQIWTNITKNVYHLYEDSAKAYFHYLEIGLSKTSGCNNVTITLRLLRLLVKHAWELRTVLEEGLATTPTTPWKSIIPQLFSRLNHPELYVRQSVSELLIRLAEDCPHLIVYPAIVGCKQYTQSTSKAMSIMDNDGSDHEGDGSTSVEQKSGLTDCFQQLVDTLSTHNPLLIQQVDTFVTELCRITVLWDELWLGTLGQLCNTAAEKIKSLASEVDRVKNNSSLNSEEKSLLIKEKRQTIVKPLVHALERLIEITGQNADTKHEQWFQDTYGPLIEKGLDRLKNPAKEEDLQADWQPFKQVFVALQQRSLKRPSHMLKMKDVSGVLSSLNDTVIPLPGILARGDRQPVTLKSVFSSVQILPTKTKPKKLAFLGCDGQKYMYLFKGLEDLHLDERIMQLLNIVNDMLESKTTSDSECAMYRARNYSVTPLGLRSGLIQWVDGCIPLFSLYKRWQVREAAAPQSKPNAGNSTVQRPSEVFYSKLIPLLRHALDDKSLKEVKDVEKIRKEWPLATLITTTKQLVAETPSHLVAKEIWCSSTSANEWWNMTQTYCRSVAVMSAIGYILGLGDRHLDNLLLDINNGEVVHIDYNVCFDKGKSLRVPERVPFRLTHNIVAAMGSTGIEGIFKSAFEHTIKCMRTEKETLLTLLEAFVYDPLVDWTVGGESGLAGAFHGGNYALGSAAKDHRHRKKQMERDITRSMFAIRVTEMKSAWIQNKDDMSTSLAEIITKLSGISDETGKISQYMQQMSMCEHILSDINELKQQGPQAVSQLLLGFEAHQKYVSVKEDCANELHTLVEELSKYSRLHQTAIVGVTSLAFEELTEKIGQLPDLGPAPSACTKSFLKSVGQASQLDQLNVMHNQLKMQAKNRQNLMRHCVDLLGRYSSIVSQFPPAHYSNNHLMGDCLLLMKQLESDFTLHGCEISQQELENNPRITSQEELCKKVRENEEKLKQSVEYDVAKRNKVVDRSSVEKNDIPTLETCYQDRLKQITSYRQVSDDKKYRNLLYAVLPRLVEVNKKYLGMEVIASKSGERLHSLTSRDGDWFLVELTCVSENLMEYVNMTQLWPTDELQQNNISNHGDQLDANTSSVLVYNIISGIHKVYVALQEMIQKFQQIILPEVLASIFKNDSSVMDIVTSLEDLCKKPNDLNLLCNNLETSLRNIIFGRTEDDEQLLQSIRSLRNSYRQIFHDSNSNMTSGQMLLKGFDGLFDHIFKQYDGAMSELTKISIPRTWRKVDLIKDAGALQQTQYNENTRNILCDLFFVRQLKAMCDFFKSCNFYVATLIGACPYNDNSWVSSVTSSNSLGSDPVSGETDSFDSLSYPIKSFIADFVRKQLIGVASQSVGYLICELLSQLGLQVDKEIELKDFGANSKVSIDDLYKKSVDKDPQYTCNGGQLVTLISMVNDFDMAWRHLDLSKRLSKRQTELQALITQQQRHLICYQWLHEEHLPASVNQCNPNRKTILTELHKILSLLLSTNPAFTELSEKLLASELSISQRLKWAAGANPSLNSVVSSFEQAQSFRETTLQSEAAIIKEISTYCNSILHLETMRTKSQETSSIVSRCRQLLDRCKQVCSLLESDDQITEEQQMMMSLMSNTDRQKTGDAFLGRAHDTIKSHMASLSSKVRGLKKSTAQLKEKYQNHVTNIQFKTLNAHHKLISEVRAVLKTLAKEEMDQPELGSEVQNYLHQYKLFSEKLANLLKIAGQDENTDNAEATIIALVSDLLVEVDSIFTRLIEIARPLTIPEKSAEMGDQKSSDPKTSPSFGLNSTSKPKVIGDADLTHQVSPVTEQKDTKGLQGADKVLRDPKTGKAIQERNSYAVSVWRRVKMKLDGRELDPNKKMSVSDQVGYIIAEAVDLKNLAQMYEGWTSWV